MRQVVLLRGINLGKRNRVPMAELRDALEQEGFEDVATYLQSGNVLLSSRLGRTKVTAQVAALIRERFGVDIPIVLRTRDELAAVVELNPLSRVATIRGSIR
jgi:uncharacterized protein (DUF1697 family)